MNARRVALIAGVLFFFLAVITQGLLPWLEPESRQTKVTRVVRTDLGELKWMEYTASDYTPLQARGRAVYIREGCWYCHSQYVRPVTGETRRWGPVTQAGEYAFDIPHLFSTRRIGPDLSRVGMKYSDEWHLAHYWDPRAVVPDSIMPRFARLFDGPYGPIAIADDGQGGRTLERTPLTESLFDFDSEQSIHLTPNAEGLVFVAERGRRPVILTPNDEYTGTQVRIVAQSEDLRGLIAYVQKLGMNRGMWRDRFEPQTIEASVMGLPLRSEEWIDYGKQVYERRCIGCHGARGDGNGGSAAFLHEVRPRDFTLGLFKFRSTPSGSLPTDGDLLRTITRGVRGTAMPSFHELPEKDRLAVIQYVKYVLAVDRSDPEQPYFYFVEEPPEPPIHIGEPPAPSKEIVARGAQVWKDAKCWECHGQQGRGDGEKAAGLESDFGFPIRPADLTAGQFKSGPSVRDIYRTLITGLMGTPMPAYADTISEEDRWALAYFVVSLSAYTDPLSRAPLRIAAQDRERLNDPGLRANESRLAYKPTAGAAPDDHYAGGEAWAVKHGIEVESGPLSPGLSPALSPAISAGVR